MSCAEYHWPDIKRLIKQRFAISGLPEPDVNKNYVQLVNDYTLIVQEYFEARVQLWLKTVGNIVFKIKHYWLRFEFAASRGQIHAHMLAISDHNKTFQIAHQLYHKDKRKEAEFLSHWAKETLGMTCNLPVSESELINKKRTTLLVDRILQ